LEYAARVIGYDSPLGLGSTSPRRRELLETVGLPLRVFRPHADESVLASEYAESYLERVVQLKLQSVSTEYAAETLGAWLVADTIVLVDDVILGKPADFEDARRMLELLSGRSHQVRTRFAIGAAVGTGAMPLHAETVSSDVWFRPLSRDEVAGYAASGEGLDKAGAYAIQGLGSFAVSRIDGSYSNIVGLPVCEVVLALESLGLLPRFPIP
jgi:septum formation protein